MWGVHGVLGSLPVPPCIPPGIEGTPWPPDIPPSTEGTPYLSQQPPRSFPLLGGGSGHLSGFWPPLPFLPGLKPHRFIGAGSRGGDPAPFPGLCLPALQEAGGERRHVRLQDPAPRPGGRLQGGDTPRDHRGGLQSPNFAAVPPLRHRFLSLSQPRDVTNFTVGGFAPMSPRISSPMHPSGAGECWGGVPEAAGVSLRIPPPSRAPSRSRRPTRRFWRWRHEPWPWAAG